jgi:hypothetical protein
MLTFPIGWSFTLRELEYVFIPNNSSFAKSNTFKGVSCPAKSALYPNVKILDLQSSVSRLSHAGQKFLRSCCQDQVLLDAPPSPWTKMMSAKGSVHVWTRLRPRLSSGGEIPRVPFRSCNRLLKGLSSGIEACRVPLPPTEGGVKVLVEYEGGGNPTNSEEDRSFVGPSSSSSMDLSSQSMPAPSL